METTRPVTLLAGRYALDELLGRSETGLSWRATDTVLHRPVTVKLIHPRLADDPRFAAALADQTGRVATLSGTGLAQVLDSGEHDGVTFVVREHVEGTSLRARLEPGEPLPVHEVVRVTTRVLRSLAEAHGAGLLHLALDPDDVIVGPDEDVRITDLGLGGAVVATRADEASVLFGDRLAPEMAMGRSVDARTDVHAVGAIMFEALTGEPPRGRTSPRSLRTDVPRVIDRAVARALDPDPDARFPDVVAFAQALGDAGPQGEMVLLPEPDGVEGRIAAWLGVPLLIAGLAAGAIALGLWFGGIEVGGPLGIRPVREAPTPAQPSLRAELPVSVIAIDPFGDDAEFTANAPRAADGDLETIWRSEDYFDGELGKPGIGLVLDLGSDRDVAGLRLWTPHPGFSFQLAIGDDPDRLLGGIGESIEATAITRVTLDDRGRYLLVWITSVVPTEDGNRAEVAEMRIVVREPSDG